MINRFLKAKHWQLFILMIGVPFGFQIIMLGTGFITVLSGSEPDPSQIFAIYKFFPMIMIIFTALFFGWFWSVALGLQKFVPNDISMKVNKFKVFFFIPLVYLTAISLFIGGTFSFVSFGDTQPSGGLIGGIAGVIVPLHLLSMFGIFYCMYFMAKTIKTVELQRKVSFSDFAGEFFLIWFYFVGIWILQPRINKIVEQENRPSNNGLF